MSDIREAGQGPDWIAVDWGTSSLRVWAMGKGGAVMAEGRSDAGMGRLQAAEFEPALMALIGSWLAGRDGTTCPVIVCGMAGARQGWRETAYRGVPCAPVAGEGLTRVATDDGRIEVVIVPGLSQTEPADVMRGEETQLAGLAARGVSDATVCLPGTHSKWVRLEGGAVQEFSTVMTGELFALLAEQSILRHSMGDADFGDERAFLAAVHQAVDHPDRVMAELFGIRARGLLGQVDKPRDTLSGLLIGAELAAVRPLWSERTVHLVGAERLVATYARALQHLGAQVEVEDGTALTLAGLRQVREQMEAGR